MKLSLKWIKYKYISKLIYCLIKSHMLFVKIVKILNINIIFTNRYHTSQKVKFIL
jgi:hypothetical protein